MFTEASTNNDSPLQRLTRGGKKADGPALIGLIVANLLPIVLTIIFGWSLGSIVVLYWWENIIVGMYAVLRILGAQGKGIISNVANFQPPAGGMPPKLFLVPFFCFHYFFFCFIHGVFVLLLASDQVKDGPMPGGSPFELFENFWSALPAWGILSLLAIFISHGISFYRYYIRAGEYKTATSSVEMIRPYGRIALLHICLIAGGFVTMMLGQPILLVLLLIVGKTAMDAGLHLFMHHRKDILQNAP